MLLSPSGSVDSFKRGVDSGEASPKVVCHKTLTLTQKTRKNEKFEKTKSSEGWRPEVERVLTSGTP